MQTIRFAHPNLVDTSGKYYASGVRNYKEHQIKIWADEFEKVGFPKNIDYLQLDLDVENRSTLTTLENLDKQVLDTYKFATITLEHDIYRGDYFETRKISREILAKRGYIIVFPDVHAGHPYGEHEDWYVHPDLVDMEFINKVKQTTSLKADEILKILDYYSN